MPASHDEGLPPAAVEITEYRKVVDRAAGGGAGARGRTATLIGIAAILLVALIVVAVTIADRVVLAVVVIALVLALASVVGFGMATARRARKAVTDVAVEVDRAVASVTTHLASVGYVVPDETALDWISTPASTATVPLVHDSVIAARWWHPAAGDDRVFVEPFLREVADGTSRDSSLPPLAPL